jgi:hypothetical protein
LGQPVCIPRRCVVCVNYFTNLLSTLVRRFMSVLICSAGCIRLFRTSWGDSCIILSSVCSYVLFAVIVGVSILFLVAWVYVIFSHPSVFCGAPFSCPGVFVIRILAVVWVEENLVCMISW